MRTAMRIGVFAMLVALPASAEPRRLTLADAVAHALSRAPAEETASRRAVVAEKRVEVARAEGVPRVSAVGQVNRSTGNVVPGATFGMIGVPGIQGPPGASRAGSGTWQSVVGATAGWDVLELVRRPRIVDAARREVAVARAEAELANLDVAARAADAYMVVAEALAVARAAEASAARTQTVHDVIAALVGQKLRPDLDLARSETELAAARALLTRTRLGTAVTSAALAEAIGEPRTSIVISDAPFAMLPATAPIEALPHPALVAREKAAEAAAARASVANLAILPKVEAVGAAWLRGGGYVIGGPNSGDANGLLPDTPNWGVGLVATWTPTDIPAALARAAAEKATATVEHAREHEVADAVSTATTTAEATLEASLAIAREFASAVAAARRAVTLANTRYTAGLGNIVEVADAERAAANAERDEAVARLEAWRALVALHHARGDLRPLLARTGG